MAKIEAGPGCPGCGFPVFVKPLDTGETVRCPACGSESEVITAPRKAGAPIGSLPTFIRDFAMTLGAGTLLLLIFTKARKNKVGAGEPWR